MPSRGKPREHILENETKKEKVAKRKGERGSLKKEKRATRRR